MEKKSPRLPGGQTVTWKEQDHPTVYANLMGFSMTTFDISCILGEVQEATTTEVIGIPRAKIILSPEQALNLMHLLGVAVKTYIANNGPLRTAGAVDIGALEAEVEARTR